jgi:hypothetical protein
MDIDIGLVGLEEEKGGAQFSNCVHIAALEWKTKCGCGNSETIHGLVYIFIYNDKFIMAIFPNLRMDGKMCGENDGKYHL